MKYGGCPEVGIAVLLQIGEASGAGSDQYHRRKEYSERITPMECEDESKPVFGVVANHAGESTRAAGSSQLSLVRLSSSVESSAVLYGGQVSH